MAEIKFYVKTETEMKHETSTQKQKKKNSINRNEIKSIVQLFGKYFFVTENKVLCNYYFQFTFLTYRYIERFQLCGPSVLPVKNLWSKFH